MDELSDLVDTPKIKRGFAALFGSKIGDTALTYYSLAAGKFSKYSYTEFNPIGKALFDAIGLNGGLLTVNFLHPIIFSGVAFLGYKHFSKSKEKHLIGKWGDYNPKTFSKKFYDTTIMVGLMMAGFVAGFNLMSVLQSYI